MRHRQELWLKVPKPVRRTLVFMIGWAVVLAGLAMLILPGPGWVAIFLGFAILATEFAFAEKVRDWLIAQLKRMGQAALRGWRSLWHRK